MTSKSASKGLALLVDEDRAVAALWRNHMEAGSATTRLALFRHYQPYARRLAIDHVRRMPNLGLERGDFEQLSMEALLYSIDRFDPALGTRFESFTRLRIKGHIRNALTKASEASAQYGYRRRVERDRLRSLREQDAGEALKSVDGLASIAAKIAIGLILEDQAAVEPDDLPSTDPSAYDTLAWRQLCGELGRRLDHLPDKEAFVIDQHYRNDLQFQQIAILMGLSKGRISQLHATGLERLRKQMSRIG
ncbi:sigma-70 family RNA polymerase sigma factor [Sphingopyxis sp.]|uniref:sigma-70 family RNA polymerase sigma factor n=1 Tax=Sphingopyxis sp. TaxID=1908224 RepID=UPI002FC78CA9